MPYSKTSPTLFEPGPARSLFILEEPASLRILPYLGGYEVLLPLADLLAFFLHLAVHATAFSRADVVVHRLLAVLPMASHDTE